MLVDLPATQTIPAWKVCVAVEIHCGLNIIVYIFLLQEIKPVETESYVDVLLTGQV